MKTMAAADFKARCLKVMDEVRDKRETVLITKKGRPVARLVPVDDEEHSSGFGALRGTLEIVGDILSPVVPASEWKRNE